MGRFAGESTRLRISPDTARSVLQPSGALLYCIRPVLCTAIACIGSRESIAEFRCKSNGLRLDVRVSFRPPVTALRAVPSERERLDPLAPGFPPRLTVLEDDRMSAGSPHKP